MSQDLAAFMDAVGVAEAILVGHSMGTSVAQQFALDHPGRVSRLVLIGAFAGYQDPDFQAFVRTSILPLTDPISADFAREWQLSTLARTMDVDHLDTAVAETLKVPAFVWHATFGGFLESADVTGALGRVTVPTLLMWGDRDTYATRAAQERLLEALPDAVLRTYECHGHALHWEDPQRFVADLVPFLTASSDAVQHGADSAQHTRTIESR
jgi:pimeloyl-ACP methyl ester carboxylesterase